MTLLVSKILKVKCTATGVPCTFVPQSSPPKINHVELRSCIRYRFVNSIPICQFWTGNVSQKIENIISHALRTSLTRFISLPSRALQANNRYPLREMPCFMFGPDTFGGRMKCTAAHALFIAMHQLRLSFHLNSEYSSLRCASRLNTLHFHTFLLAEKGR